MISSVGSNALGLPPFLSFYAIFCLYVGPVEDVDSYVGPPGGGEVWVLGPDSHDYLDSDGSSSVF